MNPVGKYKLGDSIVGAGKALILTLHEKANYEASLDADENDSNVTDELNFFAGNTLASVSVFQQVIISTNVENNNNVEQDYAVIIEVRDSNDITQLLEWQTGTLNPDGSSIIGISWTPEVEGEYEVRCLSCLK